MLPTREERTLSTEKLAGANRVIFVFHTIVSSHGPDQHTKTKQHKANINIYRCNLAEVIRFTVAEIKMVAPKVNQYVCGYLAAGQHGEVIRNMCSSTAEFLITTKITKRNPVRPQISPAVGPKLVFT